MKKRRTTHIRSAAGGCHAGRRRVRPPAAPAGPWLKRLFTLLGLVVLVIGGVLGALATRQRLSSSGFFAITALEINSCRHVVREEIEQLAGVAMHANLLAVKPSAVEAALESHGWIGEAAVERHWPDRLAIVIREKQPAALLNREDGLFYVDRNGGVIAPVALPDDIDFPVITGLEQRPAGNREELLREILRFLNYTDSGDRFLNRQAVSEIHVTERGEMVLYLLDPAFPIYLGAGADMRTKYQRLARILKNLHDNGEFRNIAHIRMEYGDNKVLVGKTAPTQSG